SLIPAGWQKPGDYPGALPELARALATYNVLLMSAEAPQPLVKGWTDGYQGFYQLLSGTLFPSFMRVSAFYIDQQEPLIVALYGEATPVIMAMAGYVAPYVVARQGTRPPEIELYGMMDMILEEIEATDLPRDEYRHLRDSGAGVLRQLLDSGVRQIPLTPPTRAMIFDEMSAQRPTAPPPQPQYQQQRIAPPPPPTDLPEPPLPPADMPEYLPPPPVTPPVYEEPPKRKFDPDAVPIFFNPASNASGSPRGTNVPPVPPLPPRDRQGQ
ncbi:MAG: hypothetical protein ABI700_20715, partial [Chloroflexota bacterium]